MARIRKSFPHSGSLPHREHRAKKGRVKLYAMKRESRIMVSERRERIDRTYE